MNIDNESRTEWLRKMADFELAKAQRLREAGNMAAAERALQRAAIWLPKDERDELVWDVARWLGETDAEGRHMMALIAAAVCSGEMDEAAAARIEGAYDARDAFRSWYARIGAERRARVAWNLGSVRKACRSAP